MLAKGNGYFEELLEYHRETTDLKSRYAKMRSLLERVARDMTSGENVQFSNLFSRLNYACDKMMLDKGNAWQLNTFRINANKVLHEGLSPTVDQYLRDLKAIAFAIGHFYGAFVPKELLEILPKQTAVKPHVQVKRERITRIRFTVDRTDDDFIYGYDEARATETPLKVRCNADGLNDVFSPVVRLLWKGSQLNLLDVETDGEGILSPSFIVLEPDYLVDISSLAECYKEYGKHPLNYIRSKFEPMENTAPILLGNAANLFLDELVNEKPENPVNYDDTLKKAFHSQAFEFSGCPGINQDFFDSAEKQFRNISTIIHEVFPSPGYRIDPSLAVLEPSFICEHLGLQGRMDLLQSDLTRLIELKSGKAQEIFRTNEITHRENHYVQMNLYLAVLHYNFGIESKDIKGYLLYSRYPRLYEEQMLWKLVKEAIALRNGIIVNEWLAMNGSGRELIGGMTPETLNQKGLKGNFWERYQAPGIISFLRPFGDPSLTLELDYFHAFWAFITREHVLSKSGGSDYETNRGVSSLWLSPVPDKSEAGEILIDLEIIDNHSDEPVPEIVLSIPGYGNDFLPNFRTGDIIILYERNFPGANVTNRQVFKGSVAELSPERIRVRLRSRQRNQTVLPADSRYAIEPDFLDSSYNSIYRGLYSFLDALPDRRDLLLKRRAPRFDTSIRLNRNYGSEGINTIVLQAKQACDYYLLTGPPGTGKTSFALKAMVEEFLTGSGTNLLLLSYTNRAVDEICDALDEAEGRPDFIRIGSELACSEKHRPRLLEHVIKACRTRKEVKSAIQANRIFAGTVSSLSGKTELFRLKTFDVAIIDEASQILEPQVIGLLSAKNEAGENAIGKFIMIGDHRQLPAVVQQSTRDSAITGGPLEAIGLTDRRNSLFERLYRISDGKYPGATGMLRRQFRMHPEIARFPNTFFYGGNLENGDKAHQTGPLPYADFDPSDKLQKLAATSRLAFFPSIREASGRSNKVNPDEALIAARLVKAIYHLCQRNDRPFVPEKTVGVITPYRSQISLIKKEIYGFGIPELNGITIDTVERFQGSQRNVIIYSFCINQPYQLEFLANTFEENGVLIDRKLNVAITRAKEQLFITGNPALLSRNGIYKSLIDFIRSEGGYQER